MSDLHNIGVSGEGLEKVSSEFVEKGLLKAREKTWAAFEKIRTLLKAGMSELEGRELAIQVLGELGAKKHWHKPYVRFGPGTALTFHDPIQKEYRLKTSDPVYMDLGPVWSEPEFQLEYEGDVGDSFVFGTNPEVERCIEVAHSLWKQAQSNWRQNRLSGGELYGFLKSRAEKQGYVLVEKVTGHRLSDYPHVKYSKERLDRVSFTPAPNLWILEFQLNDPSGRFGVFYEDLL